jgi:hypothetical protein
MKTREAGGSAARSNGPRATRRTVFNWPRFAPTPFAPPSLRFRPRPATPAQAALERDNLPHQAYPTPLSYGIAATIHRPEEDQMRLRVTEPGRP